MDMDFQFAFVYVGVQNVGAFLAPFEHHTVLTGQMNDIEKLPLLVETFYSRAWEWYESLPPNQLLIAHSAISKHCVCQHRLSILSMRGHSNDTNIQHPSLITRIQCNHEIILMEGLCGPTMKKWLIWLDH
mgnify:CR=1 FL=1